ncbi:sugar ABC transporter permease [Mycetocola spongiae]|uniref:sugar ABC transporter permease n=1 Tax=Mycetocola spongiae TaxID=2859226 RepID=UPI001CF16629|nr:sugar ABC transporter permease [Mycetocola spongiae]
MTVSMSRVSAADPLAPPPSSPFQERLQRLRSGDFGPVPVILGLVIIAVVFQLANDRFLSPQNIFNLSMQIASTGVIALGIVFVLVIGEIDLSAGAVSGVTAAAMVVLNIMHGWPPLAAILIAVAFGAGIGLLHGMIFTRLGVPSFVLTLGGLMAWQGVQLLILGNQGTINLPYDGLIAALANTTLPAVIGYLVAAGYALFAVLTQRRRARLRAEHGLRQYSQTGPHIRTAVITALILVASYVFSLWQGIPLSLLIFVFLVVIADLVLRGTTFGRKLFAVGGNAEAARRAGINVNAVKVIAFTICSALAAFGGVLAASRLFAVNQASGGSDILLNAIAAAVIGGTSLFGGRGSAYSALLGMLVIGAVSNGMDLLNQTSAVKYVITGMVLVAAVVIDSLSRRGRVASGR